MKKILATALFALLAASCVQDKGNYDYKSPDEVFPVKIADFPGGETLHSVKQGDHFVLDVAKQVTGTEPGRYTYIWYSQQPGFNESVVEHEVSRSTESPNLNLDVALLGVGAYTLVLEVRDEALDLYKRSKGVKIEVGAGYGFGFYVLKNTGTGFADIDYVSTLESDAAAGKDPETGLDARKQIPHAIAGGALPQGDGLCLAFVPFYAIDRPKIDANGDPTGALEYVDYSASGYNGPPTPPASLIKKSNMGAFFLATKDNIWTIDPLDMTPIRTKWEDEFYNTDGLSRNIENLHFYNTDVAGTGVTASYNANCYLVIDGKVRILNFAMHAMGSEAGRFSDLRVESTGADYHIAPSSARNAGGSDIVFDQLSHSFMWGNGYTYTKWSSPVQASYHGKNGYSQPADMPNLSNMPFDLVWMLDNKGNTVAALAALMKSTTANDYTLLLSSSNTRKELGIGLLALPTYIANIYPFERKVSVAADSKLINSVSRFMVYASSDVYFAYENKICWHLTSGSDIGKEEVLFTLPADETIVSTKVLQKGGTNHVLVLSNSTAGKWHLRTYKISEGDTPLNSVDIAALNNKPDFHTSGTGTAVDVAYRGNEFQLQNK